MALTAYAVQQVQRYMTDLLPMKYDSIFVLLFVLSLCELLCM